jgi:hypothetical protein
MYSLLPTRLQIWAALGNQRPALIKCAENRLWKALIDIASTPSPLKDVLSVALRDIQQMVSGDLDGCHPHWFRAGRLKFENSNSNFCNRQR